MGYCYDGCPIHLNPDIFRLTLDDSAICSLYLERFNAYWLGPKQILPLPYYCKVVGLIWFLSQNEQALLQTRTKGSEPVWLYKPCQFVTLTSFGRRGAVAVDPIVTQQSCWPNGLHFPRRLENNEEISFVCVWTVLLSILVWWCILHSNYMEQSNRTSWLHALNHSSHIKTWNQIVNVGRENTGYPFCCLK
jgi:hypothetical protein